MNPETSDKHTPAKKPDQKSSGCANFESSAPGLLPEGVEECLRKFLAVVDAENSTDEDKKRAREAFRYSLRT
ncbi:hypothetical protein FOC4_g10015257 [Fusarium odoratissimum]|uniref:Uncharacterized protein n=2 Tax=Fusarium oxysporum species complex TaxID=171631 RepID=N1R7Y5_FUSC4|nr:hypothetical protein FOC4_g10015257 [Fusarium odoratissimum]TXC04868.1 hypothetical protein FocTR4_00001357 [Fusarium oxysporum f. sp. cubense]